MPLSFFGCFRGAARYTSQLLTRIKRHRHQNTLIVGDLNTPLSAIDKSSKQKINKETRTLNDTLDQMDLLDIYIEHSTLKQQNTHSFQMHMELSPE